MGSGCWLGLGFRGKVVMEQEACSSCTRPTMVQEFSFKELWSSHLQPHWFCLFAGKQQQQKGVEWNDGRATQWSSRHDCGTPDHQQ